MRPTLRSWFSTVAKAQRVSSGFSLSASVAVWLMGLSLKRAQSAAGADHGEWGVVKGTKQRKGLDRLRSMNCRALSVRTSTM